MTPQNLTISSPTNGDCLRACVASLLDMDIKKVPNFVANGRGDNGKWFSHPKRGLNMFLWNHGYEYFGYSPAIEAVRDCAGIDGYFIGVVDSVNFKGSTHAVIFKGLELVHDPSPLKAWAGTGKQARGYYLIRKREKEDEQTSNKKEV